MAKKTAKKKATKKKKVTKKKVTSKKKTAARKIASPKKASSQSNTKPDKVDEIEEVEPTLVLEPEVIEVPFDNLAEKEPIVSDDRAIAPADPVARYMAEIRKYRILTREEEKEIATKYYETRDPKLAEMLVTSNLRFVVKVASEYNKFGARLIDLIQEGNVGLMHAVKEFNPYKGVRLITYAVWWIRGYMQDFLMRQYSMVRIGTTANQRKLYYQIHKHRDELERMGYQQGIAQLSGRLNISEGEVEVMAQRMSGRDVSLDQPVGDDDSSRFLDFQSNESDGDLDEDLAKREAIHILQGQIEEIRGDLNPRETFLLDNRLLSDEPLTLQEIGDKYGITREAVRQMESRLINKIKKQMEIR